MLSALFDPAAWKPVPGFDLTDVTYHRAEDHGTVRIAFDRPEVLNAFRPQTVDELYRTLHHARQTSDVGCVLLTGNGPSKKHGKWAFSSGGDQRIRGKDGYRYEGAEGEKEGAAEAEEGSADAARLGRLLRGLPGGALVLAPGSAGLFGLRGLLDAQAQDLVALAHLVAHRDGEGLHHSCARRRHLHGGLVALDHEEGLLGLDPVALGHEDLDHVDALELADVGDADGEGLGHA